MNEQLHDNGPMEELRAAIAAAEALAKEPEAFDEAFRAFLIPDATRFQAVLDRGGLGHECHRICPYL